MTIGSEVALSAFDWLRDRWFWMTSRYILSTLS